VVFVFLKRENELFDFHNLCSSVAIAMAMVRALALTERRYFLFLGMGASGWIM